MYVGFSAACQMSNCSKQCVLNARVRACVVCLMDKTLEIDAFITSQPGGDHKYVSFPPADKFQLQDGRFLVSFFFDTLAFQSQEAQRLACHCRRRPPPSLYAE